MRVPRMTLGAAVTAGAARTPAAAPRGGGIRPAFDDTCTAGCVGAATARRCGAECGGDLACWARCAGSGANLACVARCFTS
ncbi:MAG TPA: hypothetical protein VF092_23555 [Longimicrobium sp.]